MKIRNSNLKVKKGKIQVEIFKIKVRNYNFKVRMWEKIFHNVSRMPFRKHLMIFIYYYIRKIVLYIYICIFTNEIAFFLPHVYTHIKNVTCVWHRLCSEICHTLKKLNEILSVVGNIYTLVTLKRNSYKNNYLEHKNTFKLVCNLNHSQKEQILNFY